MVYGFGSRKLMISSCLNRKRRIILVRPVISRLVWTIWLIVYIKLGSRNGLFRSWNIVNGGTGWNSEWRFSIE